MKGKISITVILIGILILFANFSLAEKEITIGYTEHYPLAYKNEAGIASGFIIDLLKNIDASSEVYTFKYLYGDWDLTLMALEDDSIDLVAGLVEGEERLKIFDFNKSTLYLSWGTVILREEHTVESILDLEGFTLGHLKGDYFALGNRGLINKLYDFQLDVSYKGYASYTELLEAIERNEVDAGIMDQVSTRNIYDYKDIKDSGLVFAASGLKIATIKGKNTEVLNLIDDQMNTWLNNKDSYYYERYDDYFKAAVVEGFIPFYRSYKTHIWFVLFWLFLMILYAYMEFHLRTRELKDKNSHLIKIKDKSERVLKKKQRAIREKALAVDALQDHIKQFEDLLAFITRNVSLNHINSEEELFKEILEQAFSLVKAADFGYIYTFDKKKNIKIIDAINTEKPILEGVKGKYLSPIDPAVQITESFIYKTLAYCKNQEASQKLKRAFKVSKESLIVSFENKDVHYGGLILEINEGSDKEFHESIIESMLAFKNVAESYFLNENYYEMDMIFQQEMIFSLIKILELHDLYTKGHSESVANQGRRLAEYIGLSQEAIHEVYWAGLVHDIGKIFISSETLNKIDPLTNDEYEMIKKHPVYGHDALKNTKVTENMAKIVLYHHERYDGKGYPEGIQGESILLSSRIISIVDSYDAMTSDRVYKSKLSHSVALKEIEANLGTQFDPKIGRQFIEMKKEEDVIHEEVNDERYR